MHSAPNPLPRTLVRQYSDEAMYLLMRTCISEAYGRAGCVETNHLATIQMIQDQAQTVLRLVDEIERMDKMLGPKAMDAER